MRKMDDPPLMVWPDCRLARPSRIGLGDPGRLYAARRSPARILRSVPSRWPTPLPGRMFNVVYSTRQRSFPRRAPMKQIEKSSYEAEILFRIVGLDEGRMSAAAAKGILRLEFSDADREYLHRLAAKARAGTLTDEEQAK